MKTNRTRGFTIIELLAAMAVLLIMVALLSRVFGSAASTWKAGNKRIESNNTGRSAMEFMARELGGVLVSPERPTMLLASDRNDFLGMKSDAISFVSLAHRAEYRSGKKFRDVQQVRYSVLQVPGQPNRLALYRFVYENFDNGSFSAYEDDDWSAAFDGLEINPGQNGSILADNVRNFEVFITPVGATDPQEDYDYLVHGPPATIDIYLEVLAEEDAVRAALTPTDYVFMNAATRRYATRIYVQNRAGYAE